jgi:hypothetical protein
MSKQAGHTPSIRFGAVSTPSTGAAVRYADAFKGQLSDHLLPEHTRRGIPGRDRAAIERRVQQADNARQDRAADEVVGVGVSRCRGRGLAVLRTSRRLRMLICLKSDGAEASPDRVLTYTVDNAAPREGGGLDGAGARA